MKKKLLSLVLAGAMVASTSVSAFAASDTTVLNGIDTAEQQTEVKIRGEVLSETGGKPANNFNVTVPTAAAFTVSKDIGVISVPITIQNNGTQDIDVYAEEFVDSTKTAGEGITIVKESETKSQNRTYVSLKLEGSINTAYLKTESDGSGKGVYKNNTLEQAADAGGIKLANIQKQNSKDLTLSGISGTNGTVDNAVSDNFTLTLKIKKSEK